jgi:CheY-like chemotaxis protein
MTAERPLRVLVVDDEALIRWSLAETLKGGGDIVTEAESGAAAVRALTGEAAPIDVVLMDFHLADVQGFTLLSTVRRLSPDSRVIMMSAHFTPEIARQALALGAEDVVNKPIDMDAVPSLVHGNGRVT